MTSTRQNSLTKRTLSPPKPKAFLRPFFGPQSGLTPAKTTSFRPPTGRFTQFADPKGSFLEVLFMLAVDFGFWGQDVGPVSAHFLRAQGANRMYSRIGIDPLMAKESQSLCRCVCSFAEKYQAVASWLTELPSCTKGHFHCPIV